MRAIVFTSVAVAGVMALIGCDGNGTEPDVPRLSGEDTVWLDRPDRSGRLILPSSIDGWTFTTTPVGITFEPAGFAFVSPAKDVLYPGYPNDPNSFRVGREEPGVGLATAAGHKFLIIAPLAVDDTARAVRLETVQIPVTVNDRPSSSTTKVEVSSVTVPSHGIAFISSDKTKISYTSSAGFAGTDTLTYVARDVATDAVDTALVRVFVAPRRWYEVTLQVVGLSVVLNDIADNGWAVGTASMAGGKTQAVRWKDGTPELLPLGSAASTLGLRIADNGAVYGTADGAQSYWANASASPVAVTGGTFVDMSGRGDLLLSRTVSGCAAATIWFPGGTIDLPRAYSSICGTQPRAVNDKRDVFYVTEGAGVAFVAFHDSAGTFTSGPQTNTGGEWSAFNRNRVVIGRTAPHSTASLGYFGPVVVSPATTSVPALSASASIKTLTDINDSDWIIAHAGTAAPIDPMLVIGDAAFPINGLISAGGPVLHHVEKITNDGSLLGVLASGERRFLRLVP